MNTLPFSRLNTPSLARPISIAVAIALGVTAYPALSQSSGEPPSSVVDGNTPNKNAGLETITVTAQKRVQNLQEVPVAVTAFTGDEMAESVVKDVYDLRVNVPALGAFQSQSATNSSFSIRGIGTSSQNFGLESSVGLYVDGVYRPRQNSLINNLVDIAAVEVLRGPQGTLFGKNTASGAVLVRSQAPTHDNDGFIEATIGNYGLLNIAAAKSFSAIEDVLAFRVTGFNSERDGIVDDVYLGDNVMNDRNRWGARIQALYTPSDDISLRIIADKGKIDEICCAALTQLSNAKINPEGMPGTDLLLSGPLFGATLFDERSLTARVTAVSRLPISKMDDEGISAELNWQLNEELTLVSVSAYRAFDSIDIIDTDFSDADLFYTTNDAEQSSFSQELRVDYTSENMNAIVGLYYFEQDIDLRYIIDTQSQFGTFFDVAILPQLLASPLAPVLNGLNQLSELSGGTIAPLAQGASADFRFPHLAQQEHQSYALFGQIDYRVSPSLTVTAGLRYTDEEKDLKTTFEELDPNGNQIDYANFSEAGTALGNIGAALNSGQSPSAADLAAIAPLQRTGWGFPFIGSTTSPRPDILPPTLEDDQITGTLKLSYQPSNDSLYYASYSTGYKSGGTNTDRLAFISSLPADDPRQLNPVFDAEKSHAFELGLKRDINDYDFRINAALHYTTIEDFQANTYTGNGFNLQNAGDIETYGTEIEITWLPADNWQINFAYAYTKAEFDSFERGNCWVAYTWHTGIQDPGQENPSDPNPYCDRSGDRIGSEPEHYAMINVKRDIVLGDGIYSYLQVDYSYTGDMYLDSSNDPYKFQEDYTLMNVRFFINFEEYDTDLIIWGRNVLDEDYINGSDFDVPIQEGKLMAYASEPVTFGLTVKKRF
ncbi:TonB-dependent receptor [Aestuariibacter sp. AA17]|uniref:TonB-dependent receptor n=1 Tax=Fluctibacter corallii TaxID=2984329 RepID=A0ABT3A672_9ALTE|nr:TonB-dependent receptor [Aestuariibacter sp. AA17]MCV2883777.1 TonB-dependent receptor [Aestuariibacter sp. AA17]